MKSFGIMITWLVIMLIIVDLSAAEIIKPYGEWLCNYCAMGELQVLWEECQGMLFVLIINNLLEKKHLCNT